MDCNIINYDQNSKISTMIFGIPHKFVAAQYYRWKPIIVKELITFRIDRINIDNNRQIIVNKGSNVLTIFRRKIRINV